MNNKVSVRYAPSPTGIPHIGNIRTAIFDWVYSKSNDGNFILRIEDTDQSRYDPESESAIYESLEWLGLNWDSIPEKIPNNPKGSYVQSTRKELYVECAKKLIQSGHAYYDDTSPQELHALRKKQQELGLPPRYDNRGRYKSKSDIEKSITSGKPVVVRFKVPDSGTIEFLDEIRGKIIFNTEEIDDFIILKSDGMPTYHLAHIVDDDDMKITHVFRGEEWISSTPKHILIHNALKINPPKYIHVPLILGKDKSKLSKRHGAKSVLEYKNEGYLPSAVFNYLILLGWSPGNDQEILSKNEILEKFSIEKISDSSAVFDSEKLDWMNGIHIRNLSTEDLTKNIIYFLEKPYKEGGLEDHIIRPIDSEKIMNIVPFIQERLKTLKDAKEMVDFFFLEDDEIQVDQNELLSKNIDKKIISELLMKSLKVIEDIENFQSDQLENKFRELAKIINQKPGKLFTPIRISITGKKIAPPLFETLEVLGREKSIFRIKKAIKYINQ